MKIAMLVIATWVILIVVSTQLASFFTYGIHISEKKLDAYFTKYPFEENYYITTIGEPDLFNGKNDLPYIAVGMPTLTSKWHMKDVGMIPRWSKWHKTLNNLQEQSKVKKVRGIDQYL